MAVRRPRRAIPDSSKELDVDLRTDRPPSSLGSRVFAGLAAAGCAFVLLWSAWAWGGAVPSLQWPLVLAGMVAVLGTLGLARCEGRLRAALRDPVFFMGLLFLAYLTVQALNAGRLVFFHPFKEAWIGSAPPVPWLPSAFDRAEGLEMLRWFFPAWALLWGLRVWVASGRSVLGWLALMAWNAAALALLGMAQMLLGLPAPFGGAPLGTHFFASFGYANHAGAFFLLMLGVALIPLFAPPPAPRSVFPSSVFRLPLSVLPPALCLIGATLSLSRAAILLAWGVALVALVVYVRRRWAVHSVADRTKLIGAVAMGGALVLTLAAAFVGEGIVTEVRSFDPGSDPTDNLLTGKWAFTRDAAWRMWLDHPWFGVGGWGFRHLLALYVPESDWPLINLGKANVHNDVLQFLAEFGLVGLALLLGMLAAPLRALAGALRRTRPGVLAEWLPPVLTWGLTALYSLIDLPFRSPGILNAWVAILVLLPGLAREPGNRLLQKAHGE